MVQTRITTEWLLEGFKYELEATSRPKTVEYYCGHVQRFLRWAKGAGIPQEAHLIDKRHIQSFFHHLLQETETAVAGNGSRRGLQRTERTRWPYYRSLRRFFEWAIKEGYLEESGESSVIVVDGPRRCSARGGFRTVDLPLGEDSSTIGPALLLHVP